MLVSLTILGEKNTKYEQIDIMDIHLLYTKKA
jgi:hypothetical protein